MISLSVRAIDNQNPHNLKGDSETGSDSPSRQTCRVSTAPCRNPAPGSVMGQAFDQVMKACDNRARQCAEDGSGKPAGEAVNPLLPEHLSPSASPVPAPGCGAAPLPRDARGQAQLPGSAAVGVRGRTAMDPVIGHVWDSVGLAPPQADVFGHCCSRLSWEAAPSFGSASLSKLCCDCGQVLWKWIHRAESLLQPSSGTTAQKPG